MNDTFVFDIGVNDIDIDDNVDTPKFMFMSDHTDTDIFDFFSEAQQDVEPIDISGFFSEMATEPMAIEPFDYLKPFENKQEVFGEYFMLITIAANSKGFRRKLYIYNRKFVFIKLFI